MKKIIILISVLLVTLNTMGQKTYPVTTLEMVFGFSDVDIANVSQETGLRYSWIFNYGKKWNHDFNNVTGMYTGFNIRNIGFKLKENNIKEIHRAYSVGIPLALKLGSFDDHFYVYGGGEYEFLFHYKYKLKNGSSKNNHSKWFSSRVNKLMPSFFVGLQLPKGVNVRFSYYLKDFMNRNYSNSEVDYGNWKTQVYYISLSLNLPKGAYKNIVNKTEGEFANL